MTPSHPKFTFIGGRKWLYNGKKYQDVNGKQPTQKTPHSCTYRTYGHFQSHSEISDDVATMKPATFNTFFTYLFSLETENLHKEKNFIKFQHSFRKGSNTFGKVKYQFSFSNSCRRVWDLNFHMKIYQRQYIDDSLTTGAFQIKTLEKYIWMLSLQCECHCCKQISQKSELETQLASKDSTTKPQQPETSASPQERLQKVLQIWFINSIIPHHFFLIITFLQGI